MKCNLKLLEQNNIDYSFATVLVGINLHIVSNADIVNYATQYLLEHPNETNPLITELVCIDDTTSNVENMLTQILKIKHYMIEPNTNTWTIEERKLRFCLLLDLKQKISNKHDLLEKIAQLYADFNYPKDMEDFIYYMPTKNYDPLKHTLEKNEARLLCLFYNFLEKEKIELQNSDSIV